MCFQRAALIPTPERSSALTPKPVLYTNVYFGTLVAHTFVAAASRGRLGRPPAMARLKALDERFQASHLQLQTLVISALSSL